MSKQDLIVEAATQVFLQKGFGGASMDEIAKAAGVAKQTLYGYFAGKDDLFLAIIERRREELFGDWPEAIDGRRDIDEYLIHLGDRVAEMLFVEDTLELYRLVVAETPRFPEIGKMFFDEGVHMVIEKVARFLNGQGIKASAALIMAEQFFGMLAGFILTKALLIKGFQLTVAERRLHVRRVVNDFMTINQMYPVGG